MSVPIIIHSQGFHLLNITTYAWPHKRTVPVTILLAAGAGLAVTSLATLTLAGARCLPGGA